MRPTFEIQNPADYAIDPATRAVTIGLVTRQGDAINLVMPIEVLAAVVATGVTVHEAAIAQGQAPVRALSLKDFATWELGTNAHKDAVVLVLDRAQPSQVAYRVIPQAAREIGRGLLSLARQAEQHLSSVKRQ